MRVVTIAGECKTSPSWTWCDQIGWSLEMDLLFGLLGFDDDIFGSSGFTHYPFNVNNESTYDIIPFSTNVTQDPCNILHKLAKPRPRDIYPQLVPFPSSTRTSSSSAAMTSQPFPSRRTSVPPQKPPHASHHKCQDFAPRHPHFHATLLSFPGARNSETGRPSGMVAKLLSCLSLVEK